MSPEKKDTDTPGKKQVTRYQASGGVKIYCIPVQSFPNHFTNVYLVLAGDVVGLIDLGSGWGESNAELVKGVEEIRERFNEKVTLMDIDVLLITHGHMDHFGSLSFFRSQSRARVGVHELDVRQIINFEETILVVARDIRLFLKTVGISAKAQKTLMEMYKAFKNLLTSVPLDFHLSERDAPVEGVFRVFHAPGHCPGQVCIQVEDVLFTGDHLLSDITPHQSPETISRFTGLDHYLTSLRKIKAIQGLKTAFGGHQRVMKDPYGRIEEIEAFHQQRLNQVLEACHEPRTIKQISNHLFDPVSGYTVLLALEEAAAHVEYLFQRGRLAIHNLEDLEQKTNPVLHYRTR